MFTIFRDRKKSETSGKLFCPGSRRVQINYIFPDNVQIYCNVICAKKGYGGPDWWCYT